MGKNASSRIGEMLLDAGLIDEEQLAEALRLQKKRGGKFGSTLVNLGAIDETVLATYLGLQQGVGAVPLAERKIPQSVLGLVSPATAFRFGVVPVSRRNGKLRVAMVDPGDEIALRHLAVESDHEIEPAIAPQSSIYAALKRFYPEGDLEPSSSGSTGEVVDRERAQELVRSIRRSLAELESLLR